MSRARSAAFSYPPSIPPPRTRARPTCIEPSSMTITHSGASRSSDVPREQVVDQRLVAQPSPLGLPPHGIEHLGIDPNGDPRRRRIGRPLFAARPARADDADPFTYGLASSRYRPR